MLYTRYKLKSLSYPNIHVFFVLASSHLGEMGHLSRSPNSAPSFKTGEQLTEECHG